jgi:hypothetical protein
MSTVAECTLLPGKEGILVQGVLFAICCGVLLTKYCLDGAGRPFRDFLLDSSKQLAGAGFIHVLNMGCSMLLSQGSECGWYFLNIVVDCTFGVGIEYLTLQTLVLFISQFDDSVTTGNYRNDAGVFVWSRYWKQLGLWLTAVFVMKVVVVSLLAFFGSFLDAEVEDLLAQMNPEAQLPFVMIFTPMFMNALQFVLTDCFLKKKGNAHDSHMLICKEDGE